MEVDRKFIKNRISELEGTGHSFAESDGLRKLLAAWDARNAEQDRAEKLWNSLRLAMDLNIVYYAPWGSIGPSNQAGWREFVKVIDAEREPGKIPCAMSAMDVHAGLVNILDKEHCRPTDFAAKEMLAFLQDALSQSPAKLACAMTIEEAAKKIQVDLATRHSQGDLTTRLIAILREVLSSQPVKECPICSKCSMCGCPMDVVDVTCTKCARMPAAKAVTRMTAEQLAEIAIDAVFSKSHTRHSEQISTVSDALRPHIEPQERTVKAVVGGWPGGRRWEMRAGGGDWKIGPSVCDAASAKRHLESIMQAAGAVVEWEPANE